MEKIDILKKTNIGASVAEQELEGLKDYFLKTFLWEELLENRIDIVFGCKGSGKSAIYNYLSSFPKELEKKNILLTLAENPRGAVAFKDLNVHPPKKEFEFQCIWKLYFILIMTQKLSDWGALDKDFNIVIDKLQSSGLVPRKMNFTSMVKAVRDYIKHLVPSGEISVGLNEHSGQVDKLGLKISLAEPDSKHFDKGILSIDNLLEHLNESLKHNGFNVWIAIDRLDAVFQDDNELEALALRTLFQIYIELFGYSNFRLMIFLRDDIWSRIIEKGFREISHITKKESINWDQGSLFNLLMTRFKSNLHLVKFLNITALDTKSDLEFFFEKIFPKESQPTVKFSFDWIINAIEDGNGYALPRELIHFINNAIKSEIKLISEGDIKKDGFLSIDSLKLGFKEVSSTKLSTLIAEYPNLKSYIYKLGNRQIRFQLQEIRDLWATDGVSLSAKKANAVIKLLVKIGFFKQENPENGTFFYMVPMIYRPALKMPHGL
jgi:hypothetical protein